MMFIGEIQRSACCNKKLAIFFNRISFIIDIMFGVHDVIATSRPVACMAISEPEAAGRTSFLLKLCVPSSG